MKKKGERKEEENMRKKGNKTKEKRRKIEMMDVEKEKMVSKEKERRGKRQ